MIKLGGKSSSQLVDLPGTQSLMRPLKQQLRCCNLFQVPKRRNKRVIYPPLSQATVRSDRNEPDRNMSFKSTFSGGIGWGGKIHECSLKGDRFCHFRRDIYICSPKSLAKLAVSSCYTFSTSK